MPERQPRHLADLIPAGMFVGTSLILRRGGRLLFGLRPPRMEGARQVLDLTGIGGRLEPGDESVSAGARREAQEETGCDVRIVPCPETVIARGPGRVERIALAGGERPAALVFRRYRTPPHQPWHERSQGEACIVVFLADLEAEPRPLAELPALIWLAPAQVVEAGREDVPLRRLIETGAELVAAGPGAPAPDARVRLTDSQEALVLALGEGALAFYQALAAPG